MSEILLTTDFYKPLPQLEARVRTALLARGVVLLPGYPRGRALIPHGFHAHIQLPVEHMSQPSIYEIYDGDGCTKRVVDEVVKHLGSMKMLCRMSLYGVALHPMGTSYAEYHVDIQVVTLTPYVY